MAWSGGTYTKWNGVGGWVTDSLTYGIVPDRHDTQDTDFQNGINNCLTKDGQNTPTANLPMGGYKHTGAGAATGTGQYTTYNQLQDSTFAATVASVAINNTSAGTFTQSLFSNDASPTVLAIQKSRGATVGTNTIVANADVLGSIEFRGANGTGYTTAAQIRAIVDGTPGATNDMPGALVFYTTPDGSGTVTERMRIDDAGNVGIGRNNPGTYGNLEVGGSAYAATGIASSSASGAVLILAANGTSETRINTNTNHPMVFYTNNTSRMTLTATGSLTLNTAGTVIGGDFTNATLTSRNYLQTTTANSLTDVGVLPNGTSAIASISVLNNSTATNASYTSIGCNTTDSIISAGRNGSGTYLPMTFYIGGTERARIETNGNLMVAGTSSTPIASNLVQALIGANGTITASATSTGVVFVNRRTTDGDLQVWYRDGTQVGAVSVTTGTVTYGAFCGNHWSQLEDGTAPAISVGTVMESINELCEWPEETEERLPKVKISDTISSPAVYGVFMSWDNDWSITNDMHVASLGAYFCRVPAGTVLQIGDLLESAGNGMAQVQADDIIRSSTIGKVTALTQSHVEADGSFCVPTVLYCG